MSEINELSDMVGFVWSAAVLLRGFANAPIWPMNHPRC